MIELDGVLYGRTVDIVVGGIMGEISEGIDVGVRSSFVAAPARIHNIIIPL